MHITQAVNQVQQVGQQLPDSTNFHNEDQSEQLVIIYLSGITNMIQKHSSAFPYRCRRIPQPTIHSYIKIMGKHDSLYPKQILYSRRI